MVVDDTYIGLDISANHVGMVARQGKDVRYRYITTVQKEAKHASGVVESTLMLKANKFVGKGSYQVYRCRFIVDSILDFVLTNSPQGNIYVAIEDYAYSSTTNSITVLAEITGCVKEAIINSLPNASIRLHSVTTLKKWAAGKGNAWKIDMFEAYKQAATTPECFGDMLQYQQKVKKVKKATIPSTELKGVVTDLVDAWWLADLIRTEILVRDGNIVYNVLPKHQQEVFFLTTKAVPVNLLSRPFIRQEQDDE